MSIKSVRVMTTKVGTADYSRKPHLFVSYERGSGSNDKGLSSCFTLTLSQPRAPPLSLSEVGGVNRLCIIVQAAFMVSGVMSLDSKL